MANSKFSEKSNSDKHGMHTNDLHSIQSFFCGEAGLIHAILRKLFLEAIWKYIVKSFLKMIMFCLLIILVITQSFKSNIFIQKYIIIPWLYSPPTTRFHPSSPKVGLSPPPNQSLSVHYYLSSHLFSAQASLGLTRYPRLYWNLR